MSAAVTEQPELFPTISEWQQLDLETELADIIALDVELSALLDRRRRALAPAR